MSANRSDPVLLLAMHVLRLTMHATFRKAGCPFVQWSGLSTAGTQDVFTLLGVAILSK
jgi:hypothetical protein